MENMESNLAKFNKLDFRISFRRWQPLDLAYLVTQQMLTESFRKHKQELQKYIYLGWRKRVDEKGKRDVVFSIATGDSRLVAKQKFKSGEVWDVKNISSAKIPPSRLE